LPNKKYRKKVLTPLENGCTVSSEGRNTMASTAALKSVPTQLTLIHECNPEAVYFWSGSNHAGDIAGLADNGRHVGVAIHLLDKKGHALNELCSLPTDVQVRVTANVARNSSGKPIVMLCRDRALLPDGDTEVEVAGSKFVVGFRKIAANVARAAKGGANKMAEILQDIFGPEAGKAGAGHKVVIELTRTGWKLSPEELASLKRSGSQVFVDSGAFSEVKLNDSFEWEVTKPITDADWDERLGEMTKIAKALGPKAYLVAPDMVGHQGPTLERLAKYAGVVREWRRLGANVIVVLQKGRLSQIEMDAECSSILGFDDYVRGIPSKKAAATTEEIAQLTAALPEGTRVHLLGLGPESPRYNEVIQAIAPSIRVFCDSVGIKRLIGKANGPKGGPRILTKLRYEILEDWGWDPETKCDFVGAFQTKREMLNRYFRLSPECA